MSVSRPSILDFDSSKLCSSRRRQSTALQCELTTCGWRAVLRRRRCCGWSDLTITPRAPRIKIPLTPSSRCPMGRTVLEELDPPRTGPPSLHPGPKNGEWRNRSVSLFVPDQCRMQSVGRLGQPSQRSRTASGPSGQRPSTEGISSGSMCPPSPSPK